MHRYRQPHLILLVLILIVCLHRDLVQLQADEYIVRFSDRTASPMQQATLGSVPFTGAQESADSWLQRNGWQRAWPRFGLGKVQPLFFDGPPSDRYLRIDSELCTYPHIKYIALRRGGAGTAHIDRVHLVETFQHHFPAYWDAHGKVPPIVAISFEAQSRHTESVSQARLYTITFTDSTSTKTQ